MNFIPCVTWIKRGATKQDPDTVQLEKEDLRRILQGAADDVVAAEAIDDAESEESDDGSDQQIDDAEEETEGNVAPDDVTDKYNLDNYDDLEEDAIKAESLTGLRSVACFASVDDDPYITKKHDESDDDDEDDKKIRSNDNLIAVGHVDQDMSMLEFYVYNEDEQHLYVHHDIILPAYPLCLEWLNFEDDDGELGNYVAVGSMLPQIDVWDVDVINVLEPAYSLGSKKKKKKSAKKKANLDGHSDAVLCLSWNKLVRHGLASGSADFTVLLWDLRTRTSVIRIEDHSEKVQALQWHPFEAQTLLSGSCDKSVKLFDCRSTTPTAKTWTFDSEIEKVLWNHFNPYYYFVSTESGYVHYMDVRSEVPVYNMKAHDDCVTGLSLSSHCPDCLITSSMDKALKVWDTKGDVPHCVTEHDFKLGQLYCVSSCPDSPFVISAGGDNRENNFVVWDIRQFDSVVERFGNRQLLEVDFAKSNVEELMETESSAQDATDT